MRLKRSSQMKKDDLIQVKGNVYGNDVGKARILDPDYKGFKGKEGMLVNFIDSPAHVGFVNKNDCATIPLLDPRRKKIRPDGIVPVPTENPVNKTIALISEALEKRRPKSNLNEGQGYYSASAIQRIERMILDQSPLNSWHISDPEI